MNKKIFKNATWIIACRVVQSVLNLIVGMIMARYLGPSNYGLISYASSMVAFIVPIIQLGFNYVLVHEIIEHPNQEGETLGSALGISILSAFLGIFAIFAISLLVNVDETETIIVCVLYSISLVFQMTELIRYWYQAKLLSKYVALASLFARVVVSIYKIYLIITGKSIYWFAIINSLDYLIISVLLYGIYVRKGVQKLSFSINRAKKLVAKGKYFIIPGIMVAVFSQTDRIMLKLMIDDAASGYYSAAVACATMTTFVFSAIIESCRPAICSNKDISVEKYENSIIAMYSTIILLALIQSLVLTFGAKIFIHILYGIEFIAAVPILQIITWQSAFSYIGSANSIWLLSENKQKYLWIINVVGAILNVVGNLIMIPRFGGCGAAATSLVTQFFINYMLFFIIRPFRGNGILLLKASSPKTMKFVLKKHLLKRVFRT